MKHLFAAACSAALLASGVQADVIRDIAYGDGPRQQMDLYLPDDVENPPVVLFIHGGRWFRNDKDQITRLDRATALNTAGIAVASMNYTYSNQDIWPAQKNDVASALRFLKAEGDSYGFDADRMAVWGQSSGAHLTLWAGILAAENADIDLGAVVSWYAPSDLPRMKQDRIEDDVPGANERFPEPSPESLLIGGAIDENLATAKAASPYYVIEQMQDVTDLPPMMLMHGDQDVVVSPVQSVRLNELLSEKGAETSLTLVKGASHGGDLFAPMVPRVISFLQDKLGAN